MADFGVENSKMFVGDERQEPRQAYSQNLYTLNDIYLPHYLSPNPRSCAGPSPKWIPARSVPALCLKFLSSSKAPSRNPLCLREGNFAAPQSVGWPSHRSLTLEPPAPRPSPFLDCIESIELALTGAD